MDKKRYQEYKEILNSGKIYDWSIEELLQEQSFLVNRINEYNRTDETPEGAKRRQEILKEALGTYSEGIVILPPIYSNFGLKNVHIGKNVFMNFSTFLVDDADIFIGDNTMFGPNVKIITASHPISPKLRNGFQYNKPVKIGKNVWIGAGATVLPGVIIGDNSVVGAGAVVTKDVPSNVIVVGNPARVLRKITSKDDEIYDHDKKIEIVK